MGPQLTVLIIEVSLFQSVHNSRFDCIYEIESQESISILTGFIFNNSKESILMVLLKLFIPTVDRKLNIPMVDCESKTKMDMF